MQGNWASVRLFRVLVALVLALGAGPLYAQDAPDAPEAPEEPEEPTAPEEPGEVAPGETVVDEDTGGPVIITPPTAGAVPPQDYEPPPPPTPFDQGRVRIALGGSMTRSFGARYFALAAGVGVFVVKGLEVGLDAQQWFGSGPNITLLSPGLRYVLTLVPVVHPYVGSFYRHWFIGDDLADVDTVGGRLGLIYAGDSMFSIGVGAVLEGVVSECEEDCFSVYPEVSAAVSF